MTGSVLPLAEDRLLVNGFYSTFDGANVATDTSRCFGNEARLVPVPLANSERALALDIKTTETTLSVVRF